MLLESKVTEIAIGQIRGFVKPSKAERLAAFELFVELSVRVTTVSIDDERGFMRATFDNLAAISDVTREILRKHGCEAAKGRKDGNIALAVVALRVLNEIILPRLILWEPKLRDYEELRALQDPPVQAYEWERRWPLQSMVIDDLDEMRREIRAYMDTLAAIAGTPSLTDLVVPLPPSAPITPVSLYLRRSSTQVVRTLADGELRYDEVKPREKMVRWFSPAEALGTFRANRGHSPDAPGGRDPVHPIQTGAPIRIPEGADGCTWIDYVSDLGDGFDATVAVAFQITRETVTLPIDRSGELPTPPGLLPRGSLLVMGGDEVYPHASAQGYSAQLILPYQMAAEAQPSADSVPPSTTNNALVALPGNHDWYGGREHFEDVFVHADNFAGYYRCEQVERWWSVQLPHGWWMWGIDTALDNTIDDIQKAYFREAADQLREGDQVIICSPVPFWQLRQKRPDDYFELRKFLDRTIMGRGARIPLFLSGDSHFFAHYRRVDGVTDEHHITAGGGGAFMQPTHNLPEQVPYEQGAPEFKLDARWPRPVESRSMGTNLGSLRDPQFRSLFVIVAVVHALFAGLVTIRAGALQKVRLPVDAPEAAARWVIAAWPGWPILALMLIAMMLATAPNSRESQLVKGSKRYGLMHGAAQAAVFVGVAAFGRWVGPDAWWWRFGIVPLCGGVLSTVLFVMVVRWVNRSIKANDTLAFSSTYLSRYKHFLRMRINPHGDLDVYVIGIDPVGTGWAKAMEDGMPVPPYDEQAGVPKLHYVWGRTFANGKEEQVIARTRSLGRDHPETLYAMANLGRRLITEHQHSPEPLRVAAAEQAIAHLRTAVAGAETMHGPDHRTTLSYRATLADAMVAAGHRTEAITLLKSVRAVHHSNDLQRHQQIGGFSPEGWISNDTLDITRRLANAYIADGQHGWALDLLETAFQALLTQDGLGSPSDLADCWCQLAQVRVDSNLPASARTLIDEHYLRIFETLSESRLPIELAHVIRAQARIRELLWLDDGCSADEAQAAIVELAALLSGDRSQLPPTVLTADLSQLPEDHQVLVEARWALARAHELDNYPEGAVSWLEVNARILQEMDGERARANRAQNSERLGRLTSSLGQYSETVMHLRQSIRDRETSGVSEGDLLSDRFFLAAPLELSGDVRGAIAELEALIVRCTETPGAQRGLIDRAKIQLAGLLRQTGEHDRAVDLFATVDVDDLASLSWSAMSQGVVLNDHADALLAAGRADEAITLLQHAWDDLVATGATDSPDGLKVCLRLAKELGGAGNSEAAVVLLEPRLHQFGATFGPGEPNTLHATSWLAQHLTCVGRAAEAVPLLEHCLTMIPTNPDLDDWFEEWCQLLLGTAAEAADDLPRALESARTLLDRSVEESGADSERALQPRRTVAQRMIYSGDPAAAAEMLRTNLSITERILGASHDEALADRELLARALEQTGDLNGSLAVWEQMLSIDLRRGDAALSSRYHVGRLSGRVDDLARAGAMFRQLCADPEPTSQDEWGFRVDCMINLARTYELQGDLTAASSVAELAAATAAEHLPRSNARRHAAEERSESIRAARASAGDGAPATETAQ